MGAKDIIVQGYPKNLLRGSDFTYSPGCGGMGGGGICVLPATFRYIWWRVYATNFVVRNRKLVLQNLYFKSYLDGGPDGFCPNTTGASQDYDVLLCYQAPSFDVLAPADIKSRKTISAAQTLPFNLEFEADKIPQPADTAWGGIVYVVIDLKAVGRMVDGRPATDIAMRTVNYDYDERL